MACVRFENFIAVKWPRRFARQRLQGLDHTGFPIDERAVAIEGQGLEVGELRHRRGARCRRIRGSHRVLVEPDGIEPTTSSMPIVNLATFLDHPRVSMTFITFRK